MSTVDKEDGIMCTFDAIHKIMGYLKTNTQNIFILYMIFTYTMWYWLTLTFIELNRFIPDSDGH